MADNGNATGKKQNTALIAGAVVVLFVVLGAAMFFASPTQLPETSPPVAQEEAATDAPVMPVETAVAEDAPAPATTEETVAAEESVTESSAESGTEDVVATDDAATEQTDVEATAESAVAPVVTPVTKIDVNAALGDRILGDPSAPIEISEHASFSCSHCAEFHNKTFPLLKKNYIDTGKAYLVFSDFPLNAPALHASMVARCLPEERYFDFVSMLFKTQEDWAFDSKYLEYLKEKAMENGLTEESFKQCIESKSIEEGIANRMKGVQAQWNIKSTPSFVINNKTTIGGAYAYEDFAKILDEVSGVASAADSPADKKGADAAE